MWTTAKLQKTTMNKHVTKIVETLGIIYKGAKPPLRHRNAFELLVAVILSAQCTDERVNKVTPILFPKKRPCKPADILKLGESGLKSIIHSCGYYNQKTKAIWGCAKKLVGRPLPSEMGALRALPGVGAKTAQVIQSQWFKINAFPVDTHIHRVLNRLGIANSGKNRDKTERQAKAAIDKKYWSRLHLDLIYFGRQTCTARKPKCETCPLYAECRWPEKKKYLLLSSNNSVQNIKEK